MADDWFKLNMDIFGNRKIKYLRRLPDGNSIALFWIVLLAEARRCNSDGRIFLTESIPYTAEMLAEDFKFDERTVGAALKAFAQLDMIYTNEGFITIAGWEDHQNAEGLAKIRESKRLAQARWRAKQKELPDSSTVDSTVDSTRYLVDDAEEDKEEELELELDIKKEEKIDYQQIADMYNSICKSFPSLRSLSDARKKAIKARLNTYTLDDFRTVFENAEASSFLKGSNDRNWTATFDWLIKDTNMAKVLEGNYADKGKRYTRTETKPGWMMQPSMELGQAELDAIQRTLQEDTDFMAEAEEMQRKMQEKYGRKALQ